MTCETKLQLAKVILRESKVLIQRRTSEPQFSTNTDNQISSCQIHSHISITKNADRRLLTRTERRVRKNRTAAATMDFSFLRVRNKTFSVAF